MTTTEIGLAGEQRACDFLVGLGYQILQRNWYCPYGEIDIIAQKGDCILFVEVKTRKNNKFANASDAVTPRKRANIRKAASMFFSSIDTESYARFDVIEVYRFGDIHHIECAFE